MKNRFDIAVIGAGVAGVFALYRAHQQKTPKKILLCEISRRQGKRRKFAEGWFGCGVNSSGKFYINDINQLADTVDGRHIRAANNCVKGLLNEINPITITKDKEPQIGVQKAFEKLGYKMRLNDHLQWYPASIHKLSKQIAETVEDDSNITFSFENEVFKIQKIWGGYKLITQEGEFFCKNILFCAGRSGWRWAAEIFADLGISVKDDIASYGITVEMNAGSAKDLNKTNCAFQAEDGEIGNINFNGTVIMEDHYDLVISAFRSNEDRWKTNKVSFPLIKYMKVEQGKGVSETDRLGKLAYILYNDRVGKDKVKNILNNTHPLAEIKEYSWLKDKILSLESVFPNISKANYYAPTILPYCPEVKLSGELETESKGFYVAGESSGIRGLYGAAVSGVIAMDAILRKD